MSQYINWPMVSSLSKLRHAAAARGTLAIRDQAAPIVEDVKRASRNPKLSLLGRPSFGQTAIAVKGGPTRVNVVISYRQGMSVGPIG